MRKQQFKIASNSELHIVIQKILDFWHLDQNPSKYLFLNNYMYPVQPKLESFFQMPVLYLIEKANFKIYNQIVKEDLSHQDQQRTSDLKTTLEKIKFYFPDIQNFFFLEQIEDHNSSLTAHEIKYNYLLLVLQAFLLVLCLLNVCLNTFEASDSLRLVKQKLVDHVFVKDCQQLTHELHHLIDYIFWKEEHLFQQLGNSLIRQV